MAIIYTKTRNVRYPAWHIQRDAAYTLCSLFIQNGWAATEQFDIEMRLCSKCIKLQQQVTDRAAALRMAELIIRGETEDELRGGMERSGTGSEHPDPRTKA